MIDKNMKKVLVFLGYKTINYGAILQAFATMEMLKKVNVEPVLLNLDGLWKEIKIKKIKFYLLSGDFFFLIQSKGRMYCSKIYEKLNLSYGRKVRSRKKKFDDFIQTYLTLTDKMIGFHEVSVLSEQFDIVLLGSDQVWLPSSVVTDIYTLSFVRCEQTIKIAYAPSFGIGEIPAKYVGKYKDMLSEMTYISVREETGKEIVKQIVNSDCPVVADPVLMLSKNEWEEYIPYIKSDEEYIFVYLIGNNKWQREWIKRYAVAIKMKTIALIHLDEYIAYDETYFDKVLVDESPIDFFNLIRNAKVVFTDSYHCMLFSLIENKNIWCFRRFNDSKKVSTNSRLYTILLRLGIEERLLNQDSNVADCLLKDIDFISVNEKILLFQQESWNYLITSINDNTTL